MKKHKIFKISVKEIHKKHSKFLVFFQNELLCYANILINNHTNSRIIMMINSKKHCNNLAFLFKLQNEKTQNFKILIMKEYHKKHCNNLVFLLKMNY